MRGSYHTLRNHTESEHNGRSSEGIMTRLLLLVLRARVYTPRNRANIDVSDFSSNVSHCFTFEAE